MSRKQKLSTLMIMGYRSNLKVMFDIRVISLNITTNYQTIRNSQNRFYKSIALKQLLIWSALEKWIDCNMLSIWIYHKIATQFLFMQTKQTWTIVIARYEKIWLTNNFLLLIILQSKQFSHSVSSFAKKLMKRKQEFLSQKQ